MKIKIHSQGIVGSELIKDDKVPEALFGAIIEINGHVFDRITNVETKFGEEFGAVTVTFFPGQIEHIAHSAESWKELCDRAENEVQTARLADGRALARH